MSTPASRYVVIVGSQHSRRRSGKVRCSHAKYPQPSGGPLHRLCHQSFFRLPLLLFTVARGTALRNTACRPVALLLLTAAWSLVLRACRTRTVGFSSPRRIPPAFARAPVALFRTLRCRCRVACTRDDAVHHTAAGDGVLRADERCTHPFHVILFLSSSTTEGQRRESYE